MGEDNISFYIQVSSEFNHDFLSFYIDDQLQAQWSKLILFNKGFQSFPVNAGKHTFRWTYTKDESGNSGLDKCWLDHIVLPAGIEWDAITEEHENTNALHIYPNPAKDYIYVSYTSAQQVSTIELWNSLGQMVRTIQMPIDQSVIGVSTTGLKDGIYFIRMLNTETQSINSKKILLIK